ncbi:cytochrome c oxidase subunit II [Telmatobacter bradus]|uniref:cytochrome c oxidase subunit II n=1 Tax=Telmatobacter bradus TaxID=474953 RepID=UPI003B429B5C
MSFAVLAHAFFSAGMDSGWAHSVLTIVEDQPGNIFAPQATPAHTIFGLSLLVLAMTLGIFLVVGGLLAYAVWRFRRRAGDNGEPTQVYGSNQIEVLWTVVPILILVVLFLATMRVINGTEKARKPANALDVVVIGHQFWWEYRYPKLGIVTANELHIPVSSVQQPLPSYLTLTSADVDHSFWVPRLAGKTDLIPNKVNVMWMDPEKTGLYLGQCAQYCGTEHALMLIRLYVDTPEQFAKWTVQQQKPAAENPTAAAGKEVFLHTACVNCHTVSGTLAKGRFGPDLTHLASRDTLGSGVVMNTPENLRKWIDDPDSIKPGSLMPRMHLSSHDLDLVTAYMASLR